MRERDANTTRSKYASWSKGDSQHIVDAIKSRRLYNESRGTRFDSDTMVVRNRNAEPEAKPQESQRSSLSGGESRKGGTSTMGILSNSPSRSSGKSYSSFFDRMLKDAASGAAPGGGQPKAGSASWMKGMNSNVSSDKRDAIERQLKRVAQMEMSSRQPSQQMNLIQPAPQQQDPQYQQPVQPLQPMGQQITELISEGQAAASQQPAMQYQNPQPQPVQQVDLGALRAQLAQPVSRALFNSVRGRIGNLLLNDLPPEVTAELRQIAKELEQLGSLTQS